MTFNRHTLTSFQSSFRPSSRSSSTSSPPSSASPSQKPPSSQSSAPRSGKHGECYTLNYDFQHPTGRGHTCGRGFHHKHASPSAEKREFFSYLSRRCGEARNDNARRITHSSERLLAAAALHRAHNLLVVLNKQTSTCRVRTTRNEYRESSQCGTC